MATKTYYPISYTQSSDGYWTITGANNLVGKTTNSTSTYLEETRSGVISSGSYGGNKAVCYKFGIPSNVKETMQSIKIEYGAYASFEASYPDEWSGSVSISLANGTASGTSYESQAISTITDIDDSGKWKSGSPKMWDTFLTAWKSTGFNSLYVYVNATCSASTMYNICLRLAWLRLVVTYIEQPDGTPFTPSEAITADSSYAFLSNGSNPIGNGHANTTYAQIFCVTGINAETVMYYGFDVAEIPKNAEIDSVGCIAYAAMSSTSGINTATMQLSSGTTLMGTAESIESNVVLFSDCGMWTRDELENVRIRLYAQRGISSYNMSRAINFYGATLYVAYTEKSGIQGKAYIGGVCQEAPNGYANVDGVWREIVGGYVNVDGVWMGI